MIAGCRIVGHALVSADERIAGADGLMPPELYNDADWSRFQAALDAAALVVVGRVSHERTPNVKGRRRLVVSAGADGIERRDDGLWWNPQALPLSDMLAVAAPQGGTIAVAGGRWVFDLFLQLGFDGFDLARSAHVRLAGGVPVFSGVDEGHAAAEILTFAGLSLAGVDELDREAGVTLDRWVRKPAA